MTKSWFFICLIAFTYGTWAQNVTVENHDLTYEVYEDFQVRVLEKKTLTIHNKHGFDHAYFTEWTSPQRRINRVQIEIFDAHGKRIKKYNKMDLVDMANSASYEVVDTRVLAFKPQYQNYPFRITTYTEKTLKGFIGLPSWMPRNEFHMAVKEARLKLDISNEIPVRMFEKNLEIDEITQVENRTIYEWKVQNLAAVEDTGDIRNFRNIQSKVIVAPKRFRYDGYQGNLESWEAFGNWYLQLNQNRNNLTSETKAFLRKIPKDDVQETVSLIYEFMQSRTRYISIQLGIGGFQTMPALEVDENGYGDCKALTNYMKSMLQYVQIPSNYVLVKAGRNKKDVIKEFPSSQFNHVFLGIPIEQDTIFLECTSQSQPFNYLGDFTDDRNVLWVEQDNSKIIRTPVYDESYNREYAVASINLNDDGSGLLQVHKTHEGFFSDFYDYYLHRTSEQLESQHYDQFSYPDFKIQEVKIKPREKSYPRYQRNFELLVNNLTRSTRGRLIIPANLLEPLNRYLEVDQIDGFARVKRGFSIVDSVTVNIPADHFLPEIPEDVEISNSFGSYRFITKRTPKGLAYKREIVIFKGEYTEDTFDEFHHFYKEIKRNDRRKIISQTKT